MHLQYIGQGLMVVPGVKILVSSVRVTQAELEGH